jgi:hypothetical protein
MSSPPSFRNMVAASDLPLAMWLELQPWRSCIDSRAAAPGQSAETRTSTGRARDEHVPTHKWTQLNQQLARQLCHPPGSSWAVVRRRAKPRGGGRYRLLGCFRVAAADTEALLHVQRLPLEAGVAPDYVMRCDWECALPSGCGALW